MTDGFLKNTLRGLFKLVTKIPHDRYLKKVYEASKDLDEFTVFCSDCMGGLIYHAFKRQFLSPTINLSIRDGDFLKLVLNQEYYFKQEIEFINEGSPFPVRILGEGDSAIRINFEHYTSAEVAREKWHERKKRILDKDSQYIIMADQDLSDEQIREFREIDCKRKIMFTWNAHRTDGREIVHIKPYGRSRIKNYSKIRLDGFRDFEIFFDYAAWFAMKEDFMKETA